VRNTAIRPYAAAFDCSLHQTDKLALSPLLVAKDIRADFAVAPIIATNDLLAFQNGLMKQLENGTVTPAYHVECLVARPAVTIDGKIIVETCGLNDAQSLHHGEARSIDDGEGLIREGHADRPCRLEIGHCHRLNADATALNLIPKLLRDVAAITTVEQQPCFYQYMVGGDVVPCATQNGFGASVVVIPSNGGCKPD